MSLKIYSITDGYIDYLRAEHPHVYSNKEIERINARKYIGFVLEINEFKYYVPLSSPKEHDYEEVDGARKIRKDSFVVFRIRSRNGDSVELRGTVQFSDMIPVPESELILYDLENEPDEDYKNLVQEEIEFIRKNEERIRKRAAVIYNKKTSGSTEKVMEHVLDFHSLETMMKEWVKIIQ
jgi:hypothetical protein